MGDELSFDALTLDVPDGAGGVNGGSADHGGVMEVPVEGSERSRILLLLAIGQLRLELASRPVL